MKQTKSLLLSLAVIMSNLHTYLEEEMLLWIEKWGFPYAIKLWWLGGHYVINYMYVHTTFMLSFILLTFYFVAYSYVHVWMQKEHPWNILNYLTDILYVAIDILVVTVYTMMLME